MKKKLIASILSMTLVLSISTNNITVKADEKADIQQMIEQNIQKAKEINSQATDLSTQEKAAQAELNEILTKMGETQKNIAFLQSSIEKKNSEISVKNTEISKTNEDIEKKNSEISKKQMELDKKEEEFTQKNLILDKKLRSSYKNDGTVSKISMLLESENFTDLLNRVKVVNLIIKEDNRIISEVETARNEISEAKNVLESDKIKLVTMKETLEGQKKELDTAKQGLVTEKNKLDAVNTELMGLQTAKNAVLSSLQNKSAELMVALSTIDSQNSEFTSRLSSIEEAERIARIKAEEEAARLAKIKADEEAARIAEAARLTAPETPAPNTTHNLSSSGFIAPTYGIVTSQWGYRIDPVTGYPSAFHYGIDIANDYETPIIAAQSGKVVTAGWYGNYGNCVIIDHGNGFVTRYGHLNSISVNEGDYVSQGQRLGGMGSTGKSTGIHLHFEIRIGDQYSSEPVNPGPYIGY